MLDYTTNIFYSENFKQLRELQRIAFNHLSDIDFEDSESLQKMHCKAATLSSLSDPTVDDRVRDEKL